MTGPLTQTRSGGAFLNREERTARGRAARRTVTRSSMGGWVASSDRSDPVALLMKQAEGRLPELVPIRNGRMLASPLSFYRGGAAVMAADLAATPNSGIKVQLCGDAHLTNFGGYASPDRSLVFDLNDFDETHPGPWEWDVKRLVASFAIAGRARGLDLADRQQLVGAAAGAYRLAMREFAGMRTLQLWYSRITAAQIVERWSGEVDSKEVRAFERRVAKAMGKDSVRASSRLTTLVDGEPRMLSDPPLLMPLADLLEEKDRSGFERAARAGLSAYGRSLAGDRRHLFEQFRYVDMARKVVGVGSVGTRAWVVLFTAVDGADPLMLQLKEARESVLSPYLGKSGYANHGQRVVEGQRLMQASSDIFLGWNRGPAVDGTVRDFYVRQLWDWKTSTDVERASLEALMILAQLCGWTLARAHARSGDRLALAGYLGGGASFGRAMTRFAEAYADQNERDYEAFTDAAKSGRIEAEMGV
jgi:uncharacterized protein (DUF2252 family)